MIVEKLIAFMRKIFTRKIFCRFNNLIYSLSLNFIGVLNYKNFYETGENFVLHLLKEYFKNKRPVIMDIGSNVGDYSLLMLGCIPDSKIICFEPNPKTFDTLDRRIQRKNIIKENIGLSDRKGTMKFFDKIAKPNSDGTQLASVYKDVIEKNHKSKSFEMTINVDTLDNYVKSRNIPKVDFIKIDVEGHEYCVIKGGLESIKKTDFIQFEFNEMNVYSRVFFKDFWDVLNKDFKIYRMLPDGLMEIKKYIPVNCEIFAFQNYFCIKKTIIKKNSLHV